MFILLLCYTIQGLYQIFQYLQGLGTLTSQHRLSCSNPSKNFSNEQVSTKCVVNCSGWISWSEKESSQQLIMQVASRKCALYPFVFNRLLQKRLTFLLQQDYQLGLHHSDTLLQQSTSQLLWLQAMQNVGNNACWTIVIHHKSCALSLNEIQSIQADLI